MLRGPWRRDVRAAAQVSGIGVTLSIDKASGKVKVVDVVDGGPAATAGLKRGMLFNEVSFSERSARHGTSVSWILCIKRVFNNTAQVLAGSCASKECSTTQHKGQLKRVLERPPPGEQGQDGEQGLALDGRGGGGDGAWPDRHRCRGEDGGRGQGGHAVDAAVRARPRAAPEAAPKRPDPGAPRTARAKVNVKPVTAGVNGKTGGAPQPRAQPRAPAARLPCARLAERGWVGGRRLRENQAV
jgi:hypothetical protein